MNDREFQFEWDESKAVSNVYKHGVSFELATTVFRDPLLLTLADLQHGEVEERWLSIGTSANGAMLCVVYLWSQSDATTRIRLISARRATPTETRYYQVIS